MSAAAGLVTETSAASSGPFLRKKDACFNCFTKADLIRENRPF